MRLGRRARIEKGFIGLQIFICHPQMAEALLSALPDGCTVERQGSGYEGGQRLNRGSVKAGLAEIDHFFDGAPLNKAHFCLWSTGPTYTTRLPSISGSIFSAKYSRSASSRGWPARTTGMPTSLAIRMASSGDFPAPIRPRNARYFPGDAENS